MNIAAHHAALALQAVRACPDRGAISPPRFQRADGAGQLHDCRLLRRGVTLETCVACQARAVGIAQAQPEKPTLIIRAQSEDHTGYGSLARQAGQALETLGIAPRYVAPAFVTNPQAIHPFVRARLVAHFEHGTPILQIGIPQLPIEPNSHTVVWSMWETTRISPAAAATLNQAERVIVPSEWNRDGFRASGVVTPIEIVPLGYDPADGFTPRPWHDRPLTFGMAARMAHGPLRKNINAGIAAWSEAFENRPNTRLRIKANADCRPHLLLPADARVDCVGAVYTTAELAEWYESIDCLFVPSRGEGWGLHTLHAMASGRPIITAQWGGTNAFWRAEHGWPLPFTIEPAGEFWTGQGDWCVPSHEGMVAALRAAATCNVTDFRARGAAAAAAAQEFRWLKVAPLLAAALPIGPITDPNLPPNRGPVTPAAAVNYGWWNGVG